MGDFPPEKGSRKSGPIPECGVLFTYERDLQVVEISSFSCRTRKSCDALEKASFHDGKVATNTAHGVYMHSECVCVPSERRVTRTRAPSANRSDRSLGKDRRPSARDGRNQGRALAPLASSRRIRVWTSTPGGLLVRRSAVWLFRERTSGRYLVDPASSHMLVSKIKPCRSKYVPK